MNQLEVICELNNNIPRHALPNTDTQPYQLRCCDSRDCQYKIIDEKNSQKYCTYKSEVSK